MKIKFYIYNLYQKLTEMKLSNFSGIALCLAMISCAGNDLSLESPEKNIRVEFALNAEGEPGYRVVAAGKELIAMSPLGIEASEADLGSGFSIKKVLRDKADEVWEQPWGENKIVRDRHKEMAVVMENQDGVGLVMRFRAFDDGVGFRYEYETGLDSLTVMAENTGFLFAEDGVSWSIPGNFETYELDTRELPISEVENANTPFTFRVGDVYGSIHEAALYDYPEMNLYRCDSLGFRSELAPRPDGCKARVPGSFKTPWRSIQIAPDAVGLINSSLILNLNEPCKFADTSWIKPMKYVGVWWEMFTGLPRSWNYSDYVWAKPGVTDYAELKPNGRHAATTANVKRYIDFASKYGFDAVLVEGWNEGWEEWTSYNKNRHFSFTSPYPDFDVEELQAYAKAKGVKIIMHHETSANAADYEKQIDDAYRFMKEHGYDAVKTGYVGNVIPRSEYHSSQWMNNHYIYVAGKAASYHIMVNSHEAVRPTGLCRTYPNWIAQESARGTEFESFGGNNPDHTTILPFTRLMGGPMDFTPGLFEMDFSRYNKDKKDRVHSTLARQLALYVTMYSPLQMAADLPENYERFPDAFQFIRDVAVDWDKSVYLEAEPGDYITVARKAKGKNEWFIGNTSDENGHTSDLKLDFLDSGKKYSATIYRDAADASWDKNPQAYVVEKVTVDSGSVLHIVAASGGGYAVRIAELSE